MATYSDSDDGECLLADLDVYLDSCLRLSPAPSVGILTREDRFDMCRSIAAAIAVPQQRGKRKAPGTSTASKAPAASKASDRSTAAGAAAGASKPIQSLAEIADRLLDDEVLFPPDDPGRVVTARAMAERYAATSFATLAATRIKSTVFSIMCNDSKRAEFVRNRGGEIVGVRKR
jgi:hypothetical protein